MHVLDRHRPVLSPVFADRSDAMASNIGWDIELDTPDLGEGLAELIGGRLHWSDDLARVGSRLEGLHRRLVAAIVDQGPLPIECEHIRRTDRLVARIRGLWSDFAEARRHDPDPKSWCRTLELATEPFFIDWCHALCCDVLGEPIDRIAMGDGEGDERWCTLAASELGPLMHAVLDGRGGCSLQDPIRMAWRRSA